VRLPVIGKRQSSVTKPALFIAGGVAAAGTAAIAATRRGRAVVAGKTRAAANAVTPSGRREYDDVTLARKVESEIFRPEDAPKGSVSVNAENGVVFLRGKVKTPQELKDLEAAALKVDGVTAVNNLLHTGGSEAPAKVEGKTRSVAAR
jgi:osmotically-inducible protein OsmY